MSKPHKVDPQREEGTLGSVWAEAGQALTKGDICYTSSWSGGVRVMTPANASSLEKANGELLICAYDLPSGTRGRFVPWLVLDANTSALGSGDLVYLGNTTPGSYVQTLDSGAVYERAVGEVLVSNASGQLLLHPSAYSRGQNTAAASGPTPLMTVKLAIAAGGSATWTVAATETWEIIDARLIVTTGDSGTETWTVKEGSNTIVSESVIAPTADDIVLASTIDTTYYSVSGATVTAALDGATIAGTAYLLVARAG